MVMLASSTPKSVRDCVGSPAAESSPVRSRGWALPYRLVDESLPRRTAQARFEAPDRPSPPAAPMPAPGSCCAGGSANAQWARWLAPVFSPDRARTCHNGDARRAHRSLPKRWRWRKAPSDQLPFPYDLHRIRL
jgi:hypothetical protein